MRSFQFLNGFSCKYCFRLLPQPCKALWEVISYHGNIAIKSLALGGNRNRIPPVRVTRYATACVPSQHPLYLHAADQHKERVRSVCLNGKSLSYGKNPHPSSTVKNCQVVKPKEWESLKAQWDRRVTSFRVSCAPAMPPPASDSERSV